MRSISDRIPLALSSFLLDSDRMNFVLLKRQKPICFLELRSALDNYNQPEYIMLNTNISTLLFVCESYSRLREQDLINFYQKAVSYSMDKTTELFFHKKISRKASELIEERLYIDAIRNDTVFVRENIEEQVENVFFKIESVASLRLGDPKRIILDRPPVTNWDDFSVSSNSVKHKRSLSVCLKNYEWAVTQNHLYYAKTNPAEAIEKIHWCVDRAKKDRIDVLGEMYLSFQLDVLTPPYIDPSTNSADKWLIDWIIEESKESNEGHFEIMSRVYMAIKDHEYLAIAYDRLCKEISNWLPVFD